LTEKREPGTNSPRTKLTSKDQDWDSSTSSHQNYDPLLLQKRDYIGKEEQTK